MEEAIIELTEVEKRYGAGEDVIYAVRETNLIISRNECIVILGPSGSGKTTLLNLIGGLTRPDKGRITVASRDLLSLPDGRLSRFRAETIGFIFQFESLLPTLSVLDNVRLPLAFLRRRDEENRAEQLLKRAGLGDRLHAFPHQLSMGQQRRVGIARALLGRPAILLCDEPTADLDPETEAAIMSMIAEAHEEGATVLMVTHNPGLARYGTRLLRMEAGRVS